MRLAMTYQDFKRHALKQYLQVLLEDRSMGDAAKIAGVNRTYLYRLMDRAGMRPKHMPSWKLQGL
jgi:hypothetical protein